MSHVAEDDPSNRGRSSSSPASRTTRYVENSLHPRPGCRCHPCWSSGPRWSVWRYRHRCHDELGSLESFPRNRRPDSESDPVDSCAGAERSGCWVKTGLGIAVIARTEPRLAETHRAGISGVWVRPRAGRCLRATLSMTELTTITPVGSSALGLNSPACSASSISDSGSASPGFARSRDRSYDRPTPFSAAIRRKIVHIYVRLLRALLQCLNPADDQLGIGLADGQGSNIMVGGQSG